MTHFTLAHGQLRKFAPPFRSGAPAGRLKCRRRLLRIEGLEDRTTPAAVMFVDDNWHLLADVDNSLSVSVGDMVINNNDIINPGTITAIYGMNGFGTVTTGAFTGTAPGAATINDAITNTVVDGTVNVLEGTYEELVAVNKSVSLLGAQAGVDARTRTGVPESIVRGRLNLGNRTSAFFVTADGATVDGFTCRDQTDSNVFGAGIVLANTSSGVTVRNNIVTKNMIGLFAGSDGASTIERNLFDGNNNPGPAGGAGIYGEHTVGLTIDNNEFRNHTTNSAVIFAASAANAHVNVTFTNNNLHDNEGGVLALALNGGLFQGNTIQTTNGASSALVLGGSVTGVDVLFNNLSGNQRGLRIVNFGFFPGSGPNSNIEAHFNDFSNSAQGTGIFDAGAGDGYTGPLDLSGNWWGNITGPTFAGNPGGTGVPLVNAFNDTIDFEPWLVYAPDSNPASPGVQLPTNISVAAQTAPFTPTNNNYRRLVNVVDLLQDGQKVTLSGTFDWRETNAQASWALGNDGVVGTDDDFSLLVPAGINGVTITAASLGSARIQGPGDLPQVNLEGVFFFNGGDNQDWQISNLEIFDFDTSIFMFQGAGGIDAFNGTAILNNHIRVPADLNATEAPADVSQNIGIHFSFGINQTIQGNQIDLAGNGLSAGANLLSMVGMQSNTSAGDAYDGLLIDSNVIRVIGAQSTSPARILGIWENGHAHFNTITVSNNQFLNTAAGNDPAVNLQRAFRVTSHSGPTSTVTYSGNEVVGANIGFEWLAGQNFFGHQPVRLVRNTITNCATGVLVQSGGSAYLARNKITGSGAGGGVHVLDGTLASAGTGVNAVEENFITGGTGDGIKVELAGSITGAVFNNDLSNNAGLAINNLGVATVNAGGNWFGTNQAPGVTAQASIGVDFSPWLDTGTDTSAAPGFQGDFSVLHVSAASPQVGLVGQMQEGINLATSGGTVIAEAGNYPENLVIDKAVTLQGAGAATILNTAGGVGIDASAAGGNVTIQDLAINAAAAAIDASDLNSLTLSNVGIAGSTTGGTISNVSTVNVTTDATVTNQTVQITGTQFVIDGKTFTYSGVGALSITTGAGDDTFTVPSIGVNALHLDGGANTPAGDTLITTPHILATSEIVNIENIPGILPPVFVDSGNLVIVGTSDADKIDVTIRNATDLVVKMNGAEALVTPLATITGRIVVHALGGNDQVKIASNVPIGAELRGGPGNDKLIGGQGSDLLDGGLGIDTVQGGTGNDILVGTKGEHDVLSGQGDVDTLLGPAGDTIWAITGAGAGRINDLAQFNTVERLVGGAGNDTFSFRGGGSVKGTIDGGGGVNKLDYLKIGGLTVINLSIGTATRTGGVSNIRDVDGGNGPTVIVGDSQNNVLRGFGGRDLLIGGGGADVLAGGDGDDILIGGTTAYDASNTALTSLMNEWKGAAKYEIRIDHLMRVRTGGLNAGNRLTTQTVASDGVANILDGQAGRDWFFANQLDVKDAGTDERVVNL